ncbi:uncharacterized protein LOC128555757 isoform X2 [Mercenaria mercenaria]|nr:uncharacterized protein LOC128555757 isoform X2 [Mercenaria mercenaria]
MTMVYLFILQLCAVSVCCGRLEQLEERVQAIQTLAIYDIHRLKETVDRNALKIDTLTDLINRTMSYVTSTVESTTEFRHGQDEKPIERNENNEYKTSPANPDIKRLKRAFQDHKMYSVSLQENMLTQLEKAVHEKDALIKNISGSFIGLKSEIKSDLDEMRSDIALMISDVHLNTSQMLTSLSRVQSDSILMQTGELIREANRSRHMISSTVKDRLSSVLKAITYYFIANSIRLGDARVVENGLAGRVEVRYNDQWGTVCDDDFSNVSATVACKMAGFKTGVVIMEFGGGSGEIWLDNVMCSGSETNLFDCPRGYNNGIGDDNCKHHEDVGVTCF